MLPLLTSTMNRISAMRTEKMMEQEFPVTRYPVPVKKNLDLMVDWKGDAVNGRVGFGLATKQEAHGDCLVFWQDVIREYMPFLEHPCLVPRQAVSISIAFDQFVVGKAPQEFVLSDNQPMPTSSFFTYKMLSKHVQATYLNDGGEVYLAGACYYPQLKTSFQVNPLVDKVVISLEDYGTRRYKSTENRLESQKFKQLRRYFRYCETAQKKVIVQVMNSGEAMHYIYDFFFMKAHYEACAECVKELEVYKAQLEENKKVDALRKMSEPTPTKVTTVGSDEAELKESKKPEPEETDFDFCN